MKQTETFGGVFKHLREKRGYSLKEAAGDIVSPQFLGQFEQGKKSMTIDKYSRLLISIGMDWDDFVDNYDGERAMTVYRLLDDILEDDQHKGGIPAAYPIIKEQLTSYFADNPNLRHFSQEMIALIGYYQTGIDLPKDKIDPKVIHQLTRHSYLNLIESDAFTVLIDHLPLEYILTIRDEYLDRYQNRPDVNNRMNNFGTLQVIIRYLSEKGYYLETQKTIDEMRLRSSHMDFRMPINMVQIDMIEVYNLLRQNKKEALPKARKILRLLESLQDYYQDKQYVILYEDFRKKVYKLNNTGEHLW